MLLGTARRILLEYLSVPSFELSWWLSKRVFLMIPLDFGEMKKVAQSKIRWIGRFFQYGCSSRPGCCEQGYYCGETYSVYPATTLVSSCLLEKLTPKNHIVKLLIDHPSLWTMFFTSKNGINMNLTFHFDYCFRRRLLWTVLPLDADLNPKVHVPSSVVTLQSEFSSVWKCSMVSWCTCMQPFFGSSIRSLGNIFV